MASGSPSPAPFLLQQSILEHPMPEPGWHSCIASCSCLAAVAGIGFRDPLGLSMYAACQHVDGRMAGWLDGWLG